MPCLGCQCCLLLCPDGCVHHCLSKLGLDDFGTAEGFQLRIEIADKHDIIGKVVDSFKQPKVWISIWRVNGSQN